VEAGSTLGLVVLSDADAAAFVDDAMAEVAGGRREEGFGGARCAGSRRV
jgi:hypothetical protein